MDMNGQRGHGMNFGTDNARIFSQLYLMIRLGPCLAHLTLFLFATGIVGLHLFLLCIVVALPVTNMQKMCGPREVVVVASSLPSVRCPSSLKSTQLKAQDGRGCLL